jgi:hypothetical protein
MRVLTSSVLVMEAIMLVLAIPVVVVVGEQPTWFAWVLGALALVALLLPGAAGRQWYVPAGWLLQGLVVAAGGYDLATSSSPGTLPTLLVLGLLFVGLWWAALHFGRKGEAIRAQATPPS